jgi:hypothetical protein
MSDLVKRLRAGISEFSVCATCNEAADRIEALETALREIEHISRTEVYNTNARLLRVCIDARAALAPETEK